MTEREHDLDTLQIGRDQRLAARMLGGDARALREFCDTYLPKLYRYASARLPQPVDVEEVVQRVLGIAARRIETWRGEATLLTWLVRITRHEISRHLAQAARRRVFLSPSQDDAIGALVAAIEAPVGDEPEAAMRRGELVGLVQVALDSLPERYALALQMKYIDGLSTKDIAAQMQVADIAVQSLLARARRAFRTLCGDAVFALCRDADQL